VDEERREAVVARLEDGVPRVAVAVELVAVPSIMHNQLSHRRE
jgi:hypothetical protein